MLDNEVRLFFIPTVYTPGVVDKIRGRHVQRLRVSRLGGGSRLGDIIRRRGHYSCYRHNQGVSGKTGNQYLAGTDSIMMKT